MNAHKMHKKLQLGCLKGKGHLTKHRRRWENNTKVYFKNVFDCINAPKVGCGRGLARTR